MLLFTIKTMDSFSAFYNISQPNFAVVLILSCMHAALCSCGDGFRFSCLNQNLVCSWNHPLLSAILNLSLLLNMVEIKKLNIF